MKRRIFLVLISAIVLWDIGATLAFNQGARGRNYSDASQIPYRRVALVLGCAEKLGDGSINPFFANRILAAAALYHAHKVDYFLVSGDHHIASYDEPQAMKDHLIAEGVPADHIVCDYAGFHTVDSIIRAKKVFGLNQLTVVSQPFHNQRALFLARHAGIDAIAFNAQDVGGYNSFLTHCRDQASKMFALLDVYVLHKRPKFLGPPVAVGS